MPIDNYNLHGYLLMCMKVMSIDDYGLAYNVYG